MFNGHYGDGGTLQAEFYELVHSAGYFVELEDHTTANFYLYEDNDPLWPLVRDWNSWQWVLRLVEDDVFDLHEEVYDAFAKNPDRLAEMQWRQFEKFLDGVFRNNGFSTQLGAGRGDGGIDLCLYNHDAVGELVRLVQAKRYRRRAITIDAVQALAGVVQDERANRGLFVTTSRYLPSARKFAERRRHQITLADAGSVAAWGRPPRLGISSRLAWEQRWKRLANHSRHWARRGWTGGSTTPSMDTTTPLTTSHSS